MSNHTLSHETRKALDNISAYLSGENEAVQYAFSFLADMVTQNPSVMSSAEIVPTGDFIVIIGSATRGLFPPRRDAQAYGFSDDISSAKSDASSNAIFLICPP